MKYLSLVRYSIGVIVLAATGVALINKDDHSSSSTTGGTKSKTSSMSSSEEGLNFNDLLSLFKCFFLNSFMDFMVLWPSW